MDWPLSLRSTNPEDVARGGTSPGAIPTVPVGNSGWVAFLPARRQTEGTGVAGQQRLNLWGMQVAGLSSDVSPALVVLSQNQAVH